MTDEAMTADKPKKVQRRLYKNVYLIVKRDDLTKQEFCFDQGELLQKMMNPDFVKEYYPIVIDTDKLYH